MKYILSEEEFKSFIPVKEHEEIRNRLLGRNAVLENLIDSLRDHILNSQPCPIRGDFSSTYCVDCVFNSENLNICVGRDLKEQIDKLITSQQ